MSIYMELFHEHWMTWHGIGNGPRNKFSASWFMYICSDDWASIPLALAMFSSTHFGEEKRTIHDMNEY
jgi:hypothetical protein